MRNENRDRSIPLNQTSDSRIADGESDVRGWEVVFADGRHIGAVQELLVDPDTRVIRYVEVDVDAADADIPGTRAGGRAQFAIDDTHLDRGRNQVVVDRLTGGPMSGQGGRSGSEQGMRSESGGARSSRSQSEGQSGRRDDQSNRQR